MPRMDRVLYKDEIPENDSHDGGWSAAEAAILRLNRFGKAELSARIPTRRTIIREWIIVGKPKVRMPRLRIGSWRVIEVLRFLYMRQGIGPLNGKELHLEMARRGVLDAETQIMTSEKYLNLVATASASTLVKNAVNMCLDLGLIEPYYRNNRPVNGVYFLTPDGQATLEDWDSPISSGLYSGGYIDDIGIGR